MKNIIFPIIGMIGLLAGSCGLQSCQKARLVEEWTDKSEETCGRNCTAEQSDSTKVTPTFNAEDWEGVIDVNFGFEGEETE